MLNKRRSSALRWASPIHSRPSIGKIWRRSSERFKLWPGSNSCQLAKSHQRHSNSIACTFCQILTFHSPRFRLRRWSRISYVSVRSMANKFATPLRAVARSTTLCIQTKRMRKQLDFFWWTSIFSRMQSTSSSRRVSWRPKASSMPIRRLLPSSS